MNALLGNIGYGINYLWYLLQYVTKKPSVSPHLSGRYKISPGTGRSEIYHSPRDSASIKCENPRVRSRQRIKCEIKWLFTCIQTMTVNRRWVKCEMKKVSSTIFQFTLATVPSRRYRRRRAYEYRQELMYLCMVICIYISVSATGCFEMSAPFRCEILA